MKERLRKLFCLFGRHPYRYIGNDRCDRVYRCVHCGKRHVVIHTLRVNHLGNGGKELATGAYVEDRLRPAANPSSDF